MFKFVSIYHCNRVTCTNIYITNTYILYRADSPRSNLLSHAQLLHGGLRCVVYSALPYRPGKTITVIFSHTRGIGAPIVGSDDEDDRLMWAKYDIIFFYQRVSCTRRYRRNLSNNIILSCKYDIIILYACPLQSHMNGYNSIGGRVFMRSERTKSGAE